MRETRSLARGNDRWGGTPPHRSRPFSLDRLAGFVLDAFREGETPQRDEELDHLTAREREVLQLIARGYRYKEIAARLHLSVKTVETHVSAVLRKLQLSSRHEVTRWAAQRRLI